MTLRKESIEKEEKEEKEEKVGIAVAKGNDDIHTSLTGKGRVLNQSSTRSIPSAVSIKRLVI